MTIGQHPSSSTFYGFSGVSFIYGSVSGKTTLEYKGNILTLERLVVSLNTFVAVRFGISEQTTEYPDSIQIKGFDDLPLNTSSSNYVIYIFYTSDTSAYDWQNKVGETVNVELASIPINSFLQEVNTTTKDTNEVVKALPNNSADISSIKSTTEDTNTKVTNLPNNSADITEINKDTEIIRKEITGSVDTDFNMTVGTYTYQNTNFYGYYGASAVGSISGNTKLNYFGKEFTVIQYLVRVDTAVLVEIESNEATNNHPPFIQIKGLDKVHFTTKSGNKYLYRIDISDTSSYGYESKVDQTINGIVFEVESIRHELENVDTTTEDTNTKVTNLPNNSTDIITIKNTTEDTNTIVKALPDNSETISGIKADTESIKNETGEVKNIVSNIEGGIGSGTFETGEFSIVIGKGVATTNGEAFGYAKDYFGSISGNYEIVLEYGTAEIIGFNLPPIGSFEIELSNKDNNAIFTFPESIVDTHGNIFVLKSDSTSNISRVYLMETIMNDVYSSIKDNEGATFTVSNIFMYFETIK